MATYRAFVSSTYIDLKEHRSYVIGQLRKAGFFVDPMEDWTADANEPQEFSQERVTGCDLCILLVARRRGHVPAGKIKSITQLEYEKAIELNIDVLPFVLEEDSLWLTKFDEKKDDPKVEAWYQELRTRHGVSEFDHRPESIEIAPALTRWLKKKKTDLPRFPTTPKCTAPFQAPPLPAYYVDRPEQHQQLKNCLLKDEMASGTLVMSAVYGLGGIGKSTLATAVARDLEVREFFNEGILWATLGQQPDILSLLSGWILELGDRDFKPTTAEIATNHLRTLLQGKKVLLVVDDAWNAEHVDPFLVGSDRTRVLVTTREVRVKGADSMLLEELTREQSQELLVRSAGDAIGGDSEQTNALAEEVGDLPLALELAAVQLEEGIAVEDLLADLKTEKLTTLVDLDVESITEADKKRSLVASFHLSLKRLSVERLQQFAWMGVLPEDVPITSKMAATLWQMEERRAERTLIFLRRKALLLPGATGGDGKQTFRLHDLMHEAAQQLLVQDAKVDGDRGLPGLGLSLEDAHAELLNRYRSQSPNQKWNELLDDGYIHGHLAWHMEQAGWQDVLHELLAETTSEGRNGWYEACDRLGKLSFFVRDIARAWEIADITFESNPAAAIPLQMRYVMIVTSLNSMASNIPPELIAALVEKNYWSPAQGLAYALQSYAERRGANGIAKLARYLPSELFAEALEATRSIQDEYYRALALGALAQKQPELMGEALEAARSIQSEFGRASVLSALAQYLPKEFMGEALEAARSIQDGDHRARALSALAQYLPKELMGEALEAARSIQDEYYRALALSALAQYLPKELMGEALEAARSIQDEDDRAEALSTLAQYLPKELMGEALEAARSIQVEDYRALALSALAQKQPELMGEALEAARSIQDEDYWALALGALAQKQPELMGEALEAVRSIQSEYYQARVLRELAQYLPKELMGEALEAARSSSQASALRELAQYLPKELMGEALETARSIQDVNYRARALRELAQYLPKELMGEALEAVRSIQSEYYRADALSALAQKQPELMGEALEAARSIQSKSSRADALSALARYLPKELIGEALEAARLIQDESSRADALRELAQKQPELMGKALEAARSIQDESSRASVLNELAQQQPELMGEALEAARSIQDESSRASALSGMALK